MQRKFEYQYAGFDYTICVDGEVWTAEPLPGQHWAAGKHKHTQSAIECAKQDVAKKRSSPNVPG